MTITTVHEQLLEATPAAASLLRRAFREWLHRLGWPQASGDELVLALNEAVTNSVEHAYLDARPGQQRPLWVHAELVKPPGELNGLRQVVLEVSDAGRWRPPPADPGTRGRGLLLMRSGTSSLNIEPGPRGTRVRMVSRPAHPAARPSPGHAERIDRALHRHTASWPGPSTRHINDHDDHSCGHGHGRARATADGDSRR